MKKIVSILLIVCMLACLLCACGGGETKENEPVSIVGTWEYSSMDCSYTFNADGTGSYSFYGSEMKFTYTDDGSKVVLQYEGMTDTNEFAYTIEGKTLHIEDSFGSIVDYTKK